MYIEKRKEKKEKRNEISIYLSGSLSTNEQGETPHTCIYVGMGMSMVLAVSRLGSRLIVYRTALAGEEKEGNSFDQLYMAAATGGPSKHCVMSFRHMLASRGMWLAWHGMREVSISTLPSIWLTPRFFKVATCRDILTAFNVGSAAPNPRHLSPRP